MISGPRSGPGPATTCQMSLGKPASSSSWAREQRGQHGLRVRLGDHGVAGEQRGQPVAERHRERVVPGRDDPDDALGHPVDLDPGQARDDAELALGVEVLVRGTGVVAGGQRDVQRLVERVLAGLAGLPHDQVDDLVLAVQHQVVQPQQAPRALVDADPRHACCALRACANASATSTGVDCGMCASGAPLSGLAPATVCPLEATSGGSGSRRSRARARTPPAGRARDRPAPRRAVRRRESGALMGRA